MKTKKVIENAEELLAYAAPNFPTPAILPSAELRAACNRGGDIVLESKDGEVEFKGRLFLVAKAALKHFGIELVLHESPSLSQDFDARP